MTRPLAVVVGLACLAAPAGASAASLTITPEKRCYSHGETVSLNGSGFTPDTTAAITRNGSPFGTLEANTVGAFAGELTLAQSRGRRTRTYTATDGVSPTLTASDQITVSAVRVALSPPGGAPDRVMNIEARGFTTGRTLWAHVIHGKSRRHIRLGRLEGACRNLDTRRRLLRPRAAFGLHTIQFDTFRRYRRSRPVRDRASINVVRG